MGSKDKDQPPWKSWDSCLVFGPRPRSATEVDPDENPETVEGGVWDGFDASGVRSFSKNRQLPADSVVGLACCIVAGAYAGVEDVCIGIRSQREGFLRCRLDPTLSVGRLLTSLEYAPSSHYEAASSGLFDMMLMVGTGFIDDFLHPHILTVQVGLHLFEVPRVQVHYPWAVCDRPFAERVYDLVLKCIAQIVDNPDKSLGELDLLPDTDAKQIRAWNSKDLGTYDACLHEVIRKRADETPDDPAVCAWDGDLTYRELDSLSSHVAWILHGLGVDTGSAVAFLFRKSKWTIVSLLAILKAGAAAVALNHDYPIERSKYILELTRASVLLVGRDLDGMLPRSEREETHLVVDDALFAAGTGLSDESSRFVSSTVKPEDVAYIQFTSGSTGQPKGIMLEHRTYLASAVSQHSACQVSKESRVLQFASHSFDAILVEVLTPLLAGACVCIPSEESRMNDLAAAMRDLRVTWMGMTPTLARVISPDDVPGLRTLCTWGEAATIDIIAKWAKRVELINIYGPSETSAESTWHSFSRGCTNPSHLGKGLKAVNTWVVRTDNRDRLAPIGAVGELVIQGPTVSRGYLGDAARSAASFVTGAPWLPAEADQRTYYTGDLVRYTMDGELEFVGRRDTQVKIRGHRIELGEVEYQINKSRAKQNRLTSVVDVVRPAYRPTQAILVAFIHDTRDDVAAAADLNTSTTDASSFLQAPSEEFRAMATSIEEHLKKYLSSTSIPSVYIFLNRIPLTASGKADRRMLRMAVEPLSQEELLGYSLDGGRGRKPETETEKWLARLWAIILGMDPLAKDLDIRLNDSFFWLGGNSILAMKLAARARKSGLPLTVSQILKHPRLNQLAESVTRQPSMESGRHQQEQQQHQQTMDNQGLKRKRTAEDAGDRYVPLSTLSGIFADYFVDEVVVPRLGVEASNIEDVALTTDYQVENLAWTSLKTRGGTNYITFDMDVGLGAGEAEAAIRKLVAHHQILRTVYFVYKRRVYQVVLKQLPFEIVHCPETEDVAKAASELRKGDSGVPVDITRAIIKFWLVRDTGGLVKRLVMRVSHLQHDGVTQIRWCKEFGLALTGKELLPTASYPGYTHFAALHDEEAGLKFWRELLAGSSMTNVIQHASIPWRNVLDGQVETLIDTSLLRASPDTTNGTTIKAAWALVLAEMASSGDIVFGSVVWGRNAPWPGVEDVAGACIENIPVRALLAPGTTRLGLLQQVQQQYSEAVGFESFRFRRVVEECTDWRPWERLSTLVEYENLGEESGRFAIDGQRGFGVDEERPPADRHDVTIYSMPWGEKGEQTFIALDFCTGVVAEAVAQGMLDRMVHHIRGFHEDVDVVIMLAEPEEVGLPRIPLPLPDCQQAVKEGDAAGLDEEKTEGGRAMREVVERAWMDVMGCKGADMEGHWTGRVPFYEVWGNLIGAYGLARRLRDEGWDVSMEEVLENADMQSQAALLARRRES